MPKLAPHLTFNGDCAEAFQFYAQVLNGNIKSLQTFGASPVAGDMPSGYENQVMHAVIQIDGQTVTGSDNLPEQAYEDMQGCSLYLSYPSASEAKSVFDALAISGFITTPLQKTLGADMFGEVIDQFGTSWKIQCEPSG